MDMNGGGLFDKGPNKELYKTLDELIVEALKFFYDLSKSNVNVHFQSAVTRDDFSEIKKVIDTNAYVKDLYSRWLILTNQNIDNVGYKCGDKYYNTKAKTSVKCMLIDIIRRSNFSNNYNNINMYEAILKENPDSAIANLQKLHTHVNEYVKDKPTQYTDVVQINDLIYKIQNPNSSMPTNEQVQQIESGPESAITFSRDYPESFHNNNVRASQEEDKRRGMNKYYYEKYMKYKAKYLELKMSQNKN